MRQDARHRSLPPRHPRARPAGARADDQLAFAFDDRPATLGRIGPPTLATPSIDWHARGVAHELAGDLRIAIECYQSALRACEPIAQIVFDLAHALAESGERDRAAERYRQVIELDAARADAWNNLGDLLAESGDVDAAIDAFAHAIALAPDDAAAHYNLGDTLDAIGQRDVARVAFERFLQLADGPAEQIEFARTHVAD